METFFSAIGILAFIAGAVAFISWFCFMAAQVYNNREEVQRMDGRQDKHARRLRVVEDALKVWEKSQ